MSARKFSLHETPALGAGGDLVKALRVYGHAVTGQTESHIRVTTHHLGQHRIAVTNHDPMKIGTLSAILSAVSDHFGVNKYDVAQRLFG